jgi:hypothetical protein
MIQIKICRIFGTVVDGSFYCSRLSHTGLTIPVICYFLNRKLIDALGAKTKNKKNCQSQIKLLQLKAGFAQIEFSKLGKHLCHRKTITKFMTNSYS